MSLRLTKHWLDVQVPAATGSTQLISTFLQEGIVDWDAFTYQDAVSALEQLIHYAAVDYVYDVIDEEDATDPNQDNDWHQLLCVYELTDALKRMPGECPPDIPFY